MAEEFDYWISFRIKDERSRDGREDWQRYQALTDAIESVSFPIWKETTSFYLVRTSMTISEFAAHLKPTIDATKDIVLMRALANASARILGVYYDGALNEFLPYLKTG